MNAYLTAPVKEIEWSVLSSDLVEDAGKKALVVRAVYYGLKSAGASFRAHSIYIKFQVISNICNSDIVAVYK